MNINIAMSLGKTYSSLEYRDDAPSETSHEFMTWCDYDAMDALERTDYDCTLDEFIETGKAYEIFCKTMMEG